MSTLTASTSTTTLVEKSEPPKLTRSFSLPASNADTTTKKGQLWREKLRAKREPPVAGNKRWRDASLSDKERWKEWHKAKEAERKAGMTSTYFTDFYRPSKVKGGWAWWIG